MPSVTVDSMITLNQTAKATGESISFFMKQSVVCTFRVGSAVAILNDNNAELNTRRLLGQLLQ